MPTVEITQAQADALADGQNVLLTPAEGIFIVVLKGSGRVFKAKGYLTEDGSVLRAASWTIVHDGDQAFNSVGMKGGLFVWRVSDNVTIVPVNR